ncbi:MAG: hypothetical protein JW940_04445 [Polyangiaceae bacterium]|nr:hypothetical protein [Polyangiaceae bacterium]
MVTPHLNYCRMCGTFLDCGFEPFDPQKHICIDGMWHLAKMFVDFETVRADRLQEWLRIVRRFKPEIIFHRGRPTDSLAGYYFHASHPEFPATSTDQALFEIPTVEIVLVADAQEPPRIIGVDFREAQP